MYLKCHSFISILVIVGSFEINSGLENENLYKSISIITQHLVDFYKDRFLIFVNYDKSSIKQIFYFNEFVNQMIKDSKNATLKVLVHHQKKFYNLYHVEVVLFDDTTAFHYFYQLMYHKGNMNLSHTLMFISSITTFDTATIESIFRDLYHMSILNIALIVQLADDDIVLVTYFPFSVTACHSVTPVVINRYNSTQQRWLHSNFFPSKLDNFYGCPLICATWEEMPYLILEIDASSNTVIKYDGFEGKILEFAAKKMNFTTKILILSDEERNWNDNATDLKRGEILSNHADFAIGAFYYNRNADTLPYSQTSLYYLSSVYIVANVLNVYHTYGKLVYPFQTSLWFAIGLMYFLSAVVIYTLSCSKRTRRQRHFVIGAANITPYYNLCTLSVGGVMPYAQLPRYNFARFVFICWMLFTLVLRSAFQSKMYKLLSDNNHANPPQTIADVNRQDYKILCGESLERFLRTLSLTNVRLIKDVSMEQFQQIAKSNVRMAMLTRYEYFGYLRKLDSSTWQHLHLVNERIFTQPLVINVRLNSYLVHALNDQIANAQYFGYIQRWARDCFGSPDGLDSYVVTAEQTNVLSMNELGAVFLVLLWLHLLAFLAFVIEIIWYRISLHKLVKSNKCKSIKKRHNVICV